MAATVSDIHLRNLRFLESCTTRLGETAQHAGSDGEGSGESGLGATLSTQVPESLASDPAGCAEEACRPGLFCSSNE
jgi:hypothetical protein